MEKADNAASKCYSGVSGMGEGQRWSPGLGTRDPPRKPLLTSPLGSHPMEGSKTRGFRMGDGGP